MQLCDEFTEISKPGQMRGLDECVRDKALRWKNNSSFKKKRLATKIPLVYMKLGKKYTTRCEKQLNLFRFAVFNVSRELHANQ